MKNRTKAEKIGAVVLAGLCIFLVYKLVSELMGNPAGVAQSETKSYLPSPNSAQAKSRAANGSSSARSGSALDMQAIEKYQPRPLPDLNRDPFDFGPPPLTPAQKAARAAQGAQGAMTASSAAGVSHISLRAIGYSVRFGGPEAYLVDSDDVFIVHDGDVVSKRFKILKITSMMFEVQDGASGERSQLPIPVVQ